MTRYFIHPTDGDVNNSGTDESAPTTWDKFLNSGRVQLSGANEYLQACGTTQSFGDGDSSYKTFILVSSGGTAASPLIIGSYGSGSKPRLTGNGTAKGCAIRATGTTSNVIIRGLEIDGHAPYDASGRQRAIDFDSNAGKSNIVVEDNYIHDIAENGVLIYGDNVTVRRNRVRRIGEDGIKVMTATTKVHVIANDVADVSRELSTGDCIHVDGDPADLLICDNVCDHSSVDTKQCIVADYVAGTPVNVVRIMNNTCKAPTHATTHQAIAVKGPAYVSGNQVTGGSKGIYCSGANAVVCGNVIRLTGSNDGFAVALDIGNGMTAINNFLSRSSSDSSVQCDGIVQGSTGGAGGSAKNNAIFGFRNGIRFKTGGLSEEFNNFFGNTRDVVETSSPTTPVTVAVSDEAHSADTYWRCDGTLKMEMYTAEDPTPMATAGTYVQGVRLKNGRLRPGFCPIGAYAAVLSGAARTA